MAVGNVLEAVDPGEQGLEAGPDEVGQHRVARARQRAGRAGTAARDDLPGDADDHRSWRHGLDHDGVGAYLAVVPDGDRAEHLGAGADDHPVSDRGVAFALVQAGAAERDALVDRDVGADVRGFADHHAGRVIDEYAGGQRGGGMDVYPGEHAGEFG